MKSQRLRPRTDVASHLIAQLETGVKLVDEGRFTLAVRQARATLASWEELLREQRRRDGRT